MVITLDITLYNISAILLIIAFIIALLSFILHFYHHFECHEYCKVDCCDIDIDYDYEIQLQMGHQQHRHPQHPQNNNTNNNNNNNNNNTRNTIDDFTRRLSHRASIATSVVFDEVKQNNCCCCNIMRNEEQRDKLLCCCLYASVDHMEFYPMAVTVYFIILISIISFILFLLLTQPQHFKHNKLDFIIMIKSQFEDIIDLNIYNKSLDRDNLSFSNIKITYILFLVLLLWESLLNWYRFYSTKFMSLKFTKPPYMKIFGLYLIYITSFLSLIIIQIYIVYIIFPIIILIHCIFNSYCVNGFIFVLNCQYQHYINNNRGISEIIINDLRQTMTKLKICAICCILSSTLFLLTFSLCGFQQDRILFFCSPIWFIINCICWMLTFAKNTLWFKHQFRNCTKNCIKCKSNKTNKNNKSGVGNKSVNNETVRTKSSDEIKDLQDLVDLHEMNSAETDATMTELNQIKEIDVFKLKTVDTFEKSSNNIGTSIQLSTIKDDEEEQQQGQDRTDQKMEEKHEQNSPLSIKRIQYDHTKEMIQSINNLDNNNNNNNHHNNNNNSGVTPMSIIVTPAREQRANSVTYQYPADYDDADDMKNDDYFTFPDGINNDEEEEEEMSLSHTPSITATMTVSKKPKALQLLGVSQNEEISSRNKQQSQQQQQYTLKIEPLHVANMSHDDEESTTIVNRSQSARISQIQQQQSTPIKSYHGGQNNISATITYEPTSGGNNELSTTANIWELMVNDGFINNSTIRSLHELEEYTNTAANKQPQIQRQLSSHI